jgi:molybdopterin synthase sulfur carrier subunit
MPVTGATAEGVEGNEGQVAEVHGGAARIRSDVVATLRLFASAREAAGTGRDDVPGETVAEVLSVATARYGPGFAELLASCQVWRNGEPTEPGDRVGPDDEIAVLPPVSGG